MCLRPQSAGSTIPRLRPTGSSLGIAPVDYDPVVLHKPFGPRLAAGALPSRASSMVAPGRPIRVPAFAVVPHEPLHTFHPLWPVRRYPHLRISVRGPGPSGTSTHLTRQLPGTHDWEFSDLTFGELRRRNIIPIVDLCHFGVPDWIGDFQNPDFPELFAGYARAFAERFPWVQLYTPVNEMFICAAFSAAFVDLRCDRHGWC